MKNDGSDIICLSYHETNEFEPSVDNDGKIIYTRWDYVDRDAVIAHHLWYCYPDGRDPRAPHGNYPEPPYGMSERPNSEFNFRGIPGSNQYVCIAGPHHGEHYGSVILVNREIEDDGKLSQITVVTPETGFPEINANNYLTVDYGSPWPLSEDFYLVSYKDSGLYYLDRFGNRELLCTKTRGLRADDPIPLCPRKRPAVLPTNTYQEGDSVNSPNHKRATLTIKNVMVSDRPWESAPWAAQRKIKWLRIVQFFSKTTPGSDDPKIGYGSQQEPRMSLGLVPVEADGSVNCEAPVGKTIYFQLLDSNMMAVQSMRSATYVHAGEQLTCTGCHENKWNTPSVSPNTLASKRRPSKLMPEADGLEPMTYYRAVKPVFENKCVRCHKLFKQGPQDMSYPALQDYAFYFEGSNGNFPNPIVGGSRTLAGSFGASYSRMGKALLDSVHKSVVSADERHRVFMWLDLLSNEYGDFFNLGKQRAGERIWPTLDMDSINPQGVEWDYPLANYTLDATPPSIPSGLQAQVQGNSRILLNWQASQDAGTGVWAYRIYRNGVSLAYTCSTWFRDPYLKAGVNYTYQVTALNLDHRESGKSSQVSATTYPVSKPTVPQNVAAVFKEYFNEFCTIDVSWQAAVDTAYGIWFYRIYRNDSLVGISTGTTYSNSGLEGETSYSYRVSAVNCDSAESDRSAAISILTPADTFAPVLLYVFAIDSTKICLFFNERLDKSSAETSANYRLDSDLKVVDAVLEPDAKSVTVSVSPSLSDNGTYMVYLSGIKDRLGNPILVNTQMSFRVIKKGRISIACDDSYQLYVNDSLIGSGNSWSVMNSYNLNFRYTNTIAVKCNNGGGDAGLLAEIALDGYQPLGSSVEWKVSLNAAANWTSPSFNDVDWSRSTDLGAYGIGPWGSDYGLSNGTTAHWIWISPTTDNQDAYFRYTFIPGANTFKERAESEKELSFQVFPNPFNPAIQILLPGSQGQGLLRVYDVSGKCVREYKTGQQNRRLVWDGKDAGGRSVSSGLYMVIFTNGKGETLRKKAMLMR